MKRLVASVIFLLILGLVGSVINIYNHNISSAIAWGISAYVSGILWYVLKNPKDFLENGE